MSSKNDEKCSSKLDIQKVNSLECVEFVNVFGNVVERNPICAAAVWIHRPFRNVDDIFKRMCSFMDQQTDAGKKAMLRCISDLACKLVHMSTESTHEQSQAGLLEMTDAERLALKTCNAKYKDKFGFPFVICARKNKTNTILKGIAERLNNDEVTELNNGLEEVKKICYLRLCDIVPRKPLSKI